MGHSKLRPVEVFEASEGGGLFGFAEEDAGGGGFVVRGLA